MKRILIIFPLVFLSFEATSAEPSSSPLALNLNSDSLSFDVGLGWLKGESKEYVYNPNSKYKISQLNWNIGNALIAKGNISWDALYRLTLNTRGWIKLTSRNSSMDDYDWGPKQSHWNDWSSSPDSPLNYANEFDLNVTGWLIKQFNYKLGAILGYQETRFSWTAYTLRLSSRLFVGCAHSPRSHSYLCSRGFIPLPPRRILKSIGYMGGIISIIMERTLAIFLQKYQE